MEDTLQDRRSALDEFVKVSTMNPVATIASQAAQPFEHIGAMAVAVKRDEAELLQRLKAGAAAAGSDWYYRYPVKNRKENRTDWIEGPSIKLANELSRLYKNNEIDVRVQDLGDSWLIYARFIDLENGYSLTRPFPQPKSGSRMGGDDDARRLAIALAIGTSKAIRNVIVNALQMFADFAFEEAKNALVEKIGRDLEKWRARTIERVSAHVSIDRVEAVIGRVAADWLAPDVARVIAMQKAVVDGMASLSETFPPLAKAAADTTTTDVIDAFVESAPAPVTADADVAAKDSPVNPAADAAAGAAPSSAPADRTTHDMVEELLSIASIKTYSVQERLEQLDLLQIEWVERLPERVEFVRQAVATAVDVANGKAKIDAARHYLTTMAEKS